MVDEVHRGGLVHGHVRVVVPVILAHLHDGDACQGGNTPPKRRKSAGRMTGNAQTEDPPTNVYKKLFFFTTADNESDITSVTKVTTIIILILISLVGSAMCVMCDVCYVVIVVTDL